MDTTGWLTSAQVAEAVDRTPHTVRQLATTGRLGGLAVRVGGPGSAGVWLFHPSLARPEVYEALLRPGGRPRRESSEEGGGETNE